MRLCDGPSLPGLSAFLDTFPSSPLFSAKTAHFVGPRDWRKVGISLDLVHLCPPHPWTEFFLFLLV